MIKIEHLVKNYGSLRALDDVSFSVNEGEIVGFLGPNGAGKSTAMNILCGYLSCDEGKAVIGGIDILDDPIGAKRLIGFLPEQPPLYFDMTVEEYLRFIYELKGCTLPRKEHLNEVMEIVQITHVRSRVIRNLSKGYKQRVGIAQALVGGPKVLIFDEPTVGLDPRQIIEIRTLIKELGKTHTVILSTHILPEVQAVCDRIIIIDKGRIVANEKTEEISKAVAGSRRLQVKICGPEKEVYDLLKNGLPGVARVDRLGQRDMDSFTFYLESKPGVDVRKPLFHMMAKEGYAIIGLETMGMDLEDIFISVVDEPESGKKAGKRRPTIKLKNSSER